MMLDKNGAIKKPVAYVAGYYMFYENALELADKAKALCEKYGITGIYPPQEESEDEDAPYIPKDDSHPETAWMYFNRDINHLKYCDMIITQMDEMYGHEIECGTAFECGVAKALGKKLYGFLSDVSVLEKRFGQPLVKREDGFLVTDDGIAVERLGLPVNYMYQDFIIVEGTLEDCLKKVRKDLNDELIKAGKEPFNV